MRTSMSCSERRALSVVRKQRLVVVAEAQDVLRHLPPIPKRKVGEALDALRNDPSLGEPLHGKLAGRRRIRVGQLRVIYGLTPTSIVVVAIGSRKTIYVELERAARRR